MRYLSLFSVLYLTTWCLSPPLISAVIYRVFAIIALVLICSTSFKYADNAHKVSFTLSIFIILYMIGVALIYNESYARQINLFILFLIGTICGMWIDGTHEKKHLWFVVLWCFVLFSIWNTTTIRAVLVQPNIMRMFSKNEYSEELIVSAWGVGGYGYMYSAILMLSIGINILLSKRKELSIIEIIIVGYFVVSALVMSYLSQYFLALILAALSVVLGYFNRKNKSLKSSSYMWIMLFMLIVGFFLEDLLDFLIDVVDLSKTDNKLVEMRAVLEGEDIEDSEFGVRYERYSRDISLIFSNPVLGSMSFNAVGKHSAFLDLLAQYGLIIGSLAIALIIKPCREWAKKSIPVANDITLILIICATLNAITFQVAAPLCIALPAYCKLFLNKKTS